MANYATLKAAISQVIKENGNKEITGAVMQTTLLAMVDSMASGYTFAGVATPSTSAGTPDENVFWIGGAGSYSNFGASTINVPTGCICIFTYNGSFASSILYVGGVVDISKLTNTSYASLSLALADVPSFLQVGGLEIMYQDSTSGNYVKYRLMTTSWSTTKSNWLCIDETPVIDVQNARTDADFEISDEERHIILMLRNGEIETKNFNSLHTPKIGERHNLDLSIEDENENKILVLQNGEILTKNFYSKNYIKCTKFRGKKIGIVGDSISTYKGWLPSDIAGYDGATYAYYYGREDVISLPNYDLNGVQDTWWYKMALLLGLNPSADINNCSWSGSRVTGNSLSTDNAYAGCSTRRITDLAIRNYNPDIILCFISCNDWGNDVAIGDWNVDSAIPSEGTISSFRSAYALMINKIHNAYPNARIFCCTNLDDKKRDAEVNYPPTNNNNVSVNTWNNNIREIAEALGCDVINIHDCGMNYANIMNFVVDDGLHPNKAGHAMIAQKVASELIAKY